VLIAMREHRDLPMKKNIAKVESSVRRKILVVRREVIGALVTAGQLVAGGQITDKISCSCVAC
jgi:hypothetical protein